jgi:hypothetical protein
MADQKQYEDAEGNLVTPKAAPLPVQKVYEDANGKAVVLRGTPESGYQTMGQERIDTAKGKVAPESGRVAAEALPAIGSLAGPGGTLTGTGLMMMAKKYAPETFGQPDTNGWDQAGTAGRELLQNELLPRALSGIMGTVLKIPTSKVDLANKLSNFPAVRERAVQQLGDAIRGHFDNLPSSYNPAFGDYQPVKFEPQMGDYQPAQMSRILPASPIGDVRQVPTGGVTRSLTGPIKQNADPLMSLLSQDKIDPEKALDELTGKHSQIYQDAMAPQTHTNMVEILSTMKDLGKQNATDRVINYSKGKILWSLGSGGVLAGFGHPLAGLTVGGATAAPIVLNSMLGKIMENPETARLVTVAMRTPANSAEAPLIRKALTQVLPRLAQGTADVAATPDR